MIRRPATLRTAARAEHRSTRLRARLRASGTVMARRAVTVALSRVMHRTRVSEMRLAAVRLAVLRPELTGAAPTPHRQSMHHGDIANGLGTG